MGSRGSHLYSPRADSGHTHLFRYRATIELLGCGPRNVQNFFWPFQKKLADLWRTALPAWPVSNDDLGKLTTWQGQAALLWAHSWMRVCFRGVQAEYIDPVVSHMQVLTRKLYKKFPLK